MRRREEEVEEDVEEEVEEVLRLQELARQEVRGWEEVTRRWSGEGSREHLGRGRRRS